MPNYSLFVHFRLNESKSAICSHKFLLVSSRAICSQLFLHVAYFKKCFDANGTIILFLISFCVSLISF